MEVLISAVIIIMILSALVMIGRAVINNGEAMAERAQAIYLAQEGLEMVRQIRDTNWIDGSNKTQWNTLDISSNISNGSYKLVMAGSRILLTGGPSSNGESIPIGATGQTVTFTRTINISSASGILPVSSGPTLSDYAIKVTSTVAWSFMEQSKTIAVSEILTNWRPDF